MKTIHILGTGCAKCAKLQELTAQAVSELGLDCEIKKITDLKSIMLFGVMTTPALVVDGKVKAAGKVPSVEEIKALLQ
ncbi:MAG: thioredoxin family protein [Verrucomicrobiota bacterium]